MINAGHTLTIQDHKRLVEFKKTQAYSTYIRAIGTSPMYSLVCKEHSKGVDITEDLKRLQQEGKIPESCSISELNDVFKQSFARMIIPIAADIIVLKEMEEQKVDEVLAGLTEDGNIMYLLGLAEPKYYKEAEALLEAGKITRDSLAFRGLLAYTRRQEKAVKQEEDPVIIEEHPPEVKQVSHKTPWSRMDIKV